MVYNEIYVNCNLVVERVFFDGFLRVVGVGLIWWNSEVEMNYKNMEGKDGRGAPGTGPAAPLVRQPSSVYSLTFDEFQSALGRDFGSMNMDELLRSIWSAEESQAMAAAPPADPGAGIQRQGSLTLPRTLSQKTVDEVWRDFSVRDAVAGGVEPAAMASTSSLQPRRQPTLGEMTLEEFLVRAGVVREEMTQSQMQPQPVDNIANGGSSVFYGGLPSFNNAAGLALGFAQVGQINRGAAPSLMPNNPVANLGMPGANQAVMQHAGGVIGVGDAITNAGLMQGAVGLGGGAVTVAAAGSSPLNQLASDMLGKSNGEMSSVSPVPYALNGGIRGKRAGGTLEKVVERRQRRMIKNRESAARSRARKQAYTMELEAEVAKLKEQNQELQKKQAELMEMQKNKVLEVINQQSGPKRRCLRRTLTGPW